LAVGDSGFQGLARPGAHLLLRPPRHDPPPDGHRPHQTHLPPQRHRPKTDGRISR
jgi:hypothetical protein